MKRRANKQRKRKVIEGEIPQVLIPALMEALLLNALIKYAPEIKKRQRKKINNSNRKK